MSSGVSKRLPFTDEEALRASDEWGFNCGPAALCVILKLTPNELRPLLGDFERRRYMNPTQMKMVIDRAGFYIERSRRNPETKAAQMPLRGIVRIQWTGPWLGIDAPPAAAYRHTHWIATRRLGHVDPNPERDLLVYDINGGLQTFEEWHNGTCQRIINQKPRCTGWHATHRWEVRKSGD